VHSSVGMHSSVGTDIGYLGRFSELLCEFPRVPFAKSQFFEAVDWDGRFALETTCEKRPQ